MNNHHFDNLRNLLLKLNLTGSQQHHLCCFLSAGPSAEDPEAHGGGGGRSGSEAERQTGN